MTPRHDDSQPAPGARSADRPYEAPRLTPLGSVTDLTQGNLGGGADGNGGSFGGASGKLP